MAVSVEKTSNLGRRLIIEVSEESLRNKQNNILKEVSKTFKLDGFRPGHVPPAKIMDLRGEQIINEARNDAFQAELNTVLKEQNLRPASQLNIEDFKENQGQGIKFTVTFEVFPEIDLKDFSIVELTKQVADITEEDIDSGVQKLQDQFATWVDVNDRAAQNGDKLTVDFIGMLNGEAFEGGTANSVDLELGSNQFIPGFEEGLVGAKLGEEKTLNLTFPADYNAKHLAGQETVFKVTVHKIQAKLPAAVDAEFAAKIGIEDKDVSKVRDKIRENMTKYLEDLAKTRLRDQVLEKLYAAYPIDLPQAMLDREKHNLMHDKHAHGKDVSCEEAHGKLSPSEEAEIEAQAKKRVAVGLLLNEIIAKHDLKPEQGRVLAKVRSMALMYGGNAEFIQKMYYESKEFRENVQNMVLTDQAADLVVAGATIKEQRSTFYGIVNERKE